jgi:hypothetical protein
VYAQLHEISWLHEKTSQLRSLCSIVWTVMSSSSSPHDPPTIIHIADLLSDGHEVTYSIVPVFFLTWLLLHGILKAWHNSYGGN